MSPNRLKGYIEISSFMLYLECLRMMIIVKGLLRKLNCIRNNM